MMNSGAFTAPALRPFRPGCFFGSLLIFEFAEKLPTAHCSLPTANSQLLQHIHHILLLQNQITKPVITDPFF
jgi:hypothetical protein